MIASFIGLLLIAGRQHSPLYRGMSYTNSISGLGAYVRSDASLAAMASDGVNCIALNPQQSQSTILSGDIHLNPRSFGNSDAAIIHTIRVAHKLGMKILLKPMVNPRGHWRGDIPASGGWFQAYTGFIQHYAVMAASEHVEAFSVGCEFRANEWDDAEWRRLIGTVRQFYKGPITYCCNWDSYKKVSWWDAVDFIGIDAYFPLAHTPDASPEALEAAATSLADSLAAWRKMNHPDKQIAFTEIGYQSLPKTAMHPWETSGNSADPEAQANAYEAMLQAFWGRPWWAGAFWWGWSSDPDGGGPRDTDFTPQNKPAEAVMRAFYMLPMRK